MKIMKIGVLSFLLTSLPIFEVAANNDQTIKVTGNGTAIYVPSMATYTAGIETTATTAGEAVTDNTEKMNAVMSVFETLEISSKDIQTSQYSIYPVYKSRKNTDGTHIQSIEGYRVINTIAVKIKDLEKLGNFLDSIVRAGINTGGNLSFGTQNYDELLQQARRDAVKNAKKKAQTLAEAADLALSGVQSIVEQSYNTSPRPSMMMRSMEMDSSPVPIQKGEQGVSISVEVIYNFAPQTVSP